MTTDAAVLVRIEVRDELRRLLARFAELRALVAVDLVLEEAGIKQSVAQAAGSTRAALIALELLGERDLRDGKLATVLAQRYGQRAHQRLQRWRKRKRTGSKTENKSIP